MSCASAGSAANCNPVQETAGFVRMLSQGLIARGTNEIGCFEGGRV